MLLPTFSLFSPCPEGRIWFCGAVIRWLSFRNLSLQIYSFQIPFFSNAWSQLVFQIKTALIMLLPTFSLLFLVPKNRFSLVKLLPDWSTFWPCLAAGFFLYFYPFWLPRHILFLHSSHFDPAVASIFSVSFCPEGHVQQMMYRIGSGFPALALQLIRELSFLVELPFHIRRFCLRTCKLPLLPTFSYLFLVPKDWFSSVRLLSVWLPFRFNLCRIFLSGFLSEWALRWLFSIPFRNLLWSCCCQHFLCSFLSRGTG